MGVCKKFLYETDIELTQYLVNQSDMYKYSRSDRDYIWIRCPLCGMLSQRSVRAFVTRPTYCKKCCDGMSYPNKFMLNVLLQVGINVEPEKIFNWSNNRRYDDYIDEYSIIIENHGLQHYEPMKSQIYLSLEEQKKIDLLKKELALANGIKHYIEIDCRVSEMEWIKKSILESELPQILCFQECDINWAECDLYAKKSLLIEACTLWREQHCSVVEIAEKLNICRLTVTTYLKSGAKLGLCDYDPYLESQKILIKGRTREVERKKCKPIAVYNTIGMIAVFDGAVQLSNASDRLFGVHISRPMITNVCQGKMKSNVGLKFKQITKDEYERLYNDFGGNVNLELFNPNIKYSSREKPIAVLQNDDVIDMFGGRKEAAVIMTTRLGIKFTPHGIVHVCLGKQKQHNGFTFKHVTREEYEQYKMINNNEVVKEDVI